MIHLYDSIFCFLFRQNKNTNNTYNYVYTISIMNSKLLLSIYSKTKTPFKIYLCGSIMYNLYWSGVYSYKSVKMYKTETIPKVPKVPNQNINSIYGAILFGLKYDISNRIYYSLIYPADWMNTICQNIVMWLCS